MPCCRKYVFKMADLFHNGEKIQQERDFRFCRYPHKSPNSRKLRFFHRETRALAHRKGHDLTSYIYSDEMLSFTDDSLRLYEVRFSSACQTINLQKGDFRFMSCTPSVYVTCDITAATASSCSSSRAGITYSLFFQTSALKKKKCYSASCGSDVFFFFNLSMSPCWWTYLQLSCKKQPSTSLRSGPGQRCRSPERWACAGRKRASWGWKWPADPRGEWSLGRKRNANISEGQSYCSLQ